RRRLFPHRRIQQPRQRGRSRATVAGIEMVTRLATHFLVGRTSSRAGLANDFTPPKDAPSKSLCSSRRLVLLRIRPVVVMETCNGTPRKRHVLILDDNISL